MKHKILGYLFLAVAIAAIISVIYYLEIASQAPIELPTHTPAEVKNYFNPDYGLAVEFDRQYTLDTAGVEPNFFRTKGQTLADISIPQSLYPGTNFGSAHATLAVRPDTADADCAYYRNGNNSSALIHASSEVNDYKSYQTKITEAAAGTVYETHLYHIPHNGQCYEISLNVGLANIQNYEPGTVQPINEQDLWTKLEAILNNFTFSD